MKFKILKMPFLRRIKGYRYSFNHYCIQVSSVPFVSLWTADSSLEIMQRIYSLHSISSWENMPAQQVAQ